MPLFDWSGPGVPEKQPPAPSPTLPADTFVREEDRARLTGQNAALLAWLKAGERVTPRTAFERGITRLAARVWDLRKAGHNVKSDYDGAQKCAVYWIDAPTTPTTPSKETKR